MEKFEKPKIEEKEAGIKLPEFEVEEFEKARKNFENLTRQLTPTMQRHEYNIIIGDDASGRIPTLVIGGLFKEIYEENRVNLPQIRFFAAGRHGMYEEDIEKDTGKYLRRLITKKEINPQDKVLLTTEHIHSGRNTVCLIRAIKEAGLSCDIATLCSHREPRDYQEDPSFSTYQPQMKGLKIYSGGIISSLDRPNFYNLSLISGVEKEKDKMFAKPISKERGRDIMKAARRDVKKMVDYLKQVYDQEKEKIEK